jgi:TRAP-type C4-dicarboxylate transport system substrate-binding protein
VVPLAWGENGYREISNSKHAIKTPADLKGMKIRVVARPCSWTPSPPWAPTPRR